ncbi:MAG: hypothetical protein Kow0042_11620 [Calditrichia bacterium]
MEKKEKLQIEIEVPSQALHVEHVYCPRGHALSDPSTRIHGYPAIKVKVKYKQQEGFLYLDPVYGSYDNIEKDIEIPQKGVVKFYCPECGVPLQAEGETCQVCSAPLFLFHLPKGGIIEGCLRKGCLFHKMKIVDAEEQIARLFQNDTLESFL